MKAGPVLLLHAVNAAPEALANRHLHNIHPQALHQLLHRLKAKFQFVTVDDYVGATNRRQLAALTFDDGYRSVFEQGLPVLENLDIPCTIFLNGHTVSGGIFWRDKIRWLISKGLVARWLESTAGRFSLPPDKLYFQSKQPHYNSGLIDQHLDIFLATLDHDLTVDQDCFTTEGLLPEHPLIHYGNHGHRHYMLSSLSQAEIAAEMVQTQELLAKKSPKPTSKLFAMPFGTRRSYNAKVLAILSDFGYRGVLLSSPHFRGNVSTIEKPILVSRWYVPRRFNTLKHD